MTRKLVLSTLSVLLVAGAGISPAHAASIRECDRTVTWTFSPALTLVPALGNGTATAAVVNNRPSCITTGTGLPPASETLNFVYSAGSTCLAAALVPSAGTDGEGVLVGAGGVASVTTANQVNGSPQFTVVAEDVISLACGAASGSSILPGKAVWITESP